MGIASHEFETDDGQHSDTRKLEAKSEASVSGYDAFISYSHRGDRELARSVERTLWKFGQPWYGIRGTRTYRDETDLSAHPDLWGSIKRAVEQSRCLLLLASPDSARSKWVPREVAAAIAKHGRNSVCTLLTAGVLPETDDISPDKLAEREDSAMSQEVWDLLDAGEGERFVIDLRPFRDMPESTRQRDGEYLSRVASVAAKALQREKQDIWGQFYRAQRLRGYFLASIAVVLFGLLAGLGLALRSTRLATGIAERNESEAKRQQGIAERNESEAKRQQGIAERNESEAKRQQGIAGKERMAALEQRDIAIGHQLAAQAEAIESQNTLDLEPAALLAIESLKLFPNLEADRALRESMALLPREVVHFTDKEHITITMSADGARALIAGPAGTAQIIATSNGMPICRLDGSPEINSASFSTDGRLIALGGRDDAVHVFDARTGKQLSIFGLPKSIGRMAFGPTGALAVVSNRGSSGVYDALTGKEISLLKQEGAVCDLRSVMEESWLPRVARTERLGSSMSHSAARSLP